MKPRTLTALSGLVLAFAAGATVAGPATVSLLTVSQSGGVADEHRTLPDQANEHAGGPAAAPSASESAPHLPPCPADVKNHGAYVSSVAHGPHDGALVAAAAQSDCGKPDGSGEDGTPSASPSPGAPDHPTNDDHPGKDDHPTGRPSWSHR